MALKLKAAFVFNFIHAEREMGGGGGGASETKLPVSSACGSNNFYLPPALDLTLSCTNKPSVVTDHRAVRN